MLKRAFLGLVLTTIMFSQITAMRINPRAKSFRYSTTVETERPMLSGVTRELISAYQRNPTEANKQALRNQIAINYDGVLERKRQKLDELTRTAGREKVVEMQAIVDEMVKDRENRIEQALSRFTDPRLKPGIRETRDGFLPVLGAAQNISIAYKTITNEEYARFIKATRRKNPSHWKSASCPTGDESFPVTNVSYDDAVAYCEWLSVNDRSARYRLPTEGEWEQAAGHMPKDADFNAGENSGPTPAISYQNTLSASGAINMWGNVWEWTSTARGNQMKAVKGGAWNSKRTDCRTENREEGRNPIAGYDNVGFRIIRERTIPSGSGLRRK